MQPSNQTAAAAAAAAAAAKKKKKKGKAKKTDDALDALGMPPPSSNHTFSATAQAQADLIATASDLYRRIEADPQGIPDDEAYWTSLPAHLRTFIRNALPIGQLPTAATGNINDPNARQASSTQAMIAMAQQLAQAAHASQRQLQQHSPSSNNHGAVNPNAYPPFPFDPSIFADLAIHADQPLPLHPHPNSTPNPMNGNAYGYSHHGNPPPTQPPGEPLPAPAAPVVLVNEYDDGDFEDDYYSEEEMDAHDYDHHHHSHNHASINTIDSRGAHIHAEMNGSHPNNNHVDSVPSSKKNKKKKKKKSGAAATTNASSPLQNDAPAPVTRPPPSNPLPLPRMPNAPTPAPTQNYPSNNTTANQTAARQAAAAAAVNQAPPPPSSRAAGKQPMTFNASAGKAPANTARPATNGVGHGVGKRAASAATSSHGHGSVNGQHAVDGRSWSSSNAEERERIKGYWLRLSEKDRRSLIREEKDAVLRRTREQQRHGCHCAICQRKRHSIEEELDALYDAYYHELDAYASHLKKHTDSNGQVPPPPGPGPFPGSIALDNQGAVIGGNNLTKASAKRGNLQPPVNKRNPLPPEDDDGYDDEELEDDEYDDEYEYEDEEDEEDELDDPDLSKTGRRRSDRPNTRQSGDFFSFGSSLTVKGILTVADDLLRNDGRKFLEMMEQLADRRAHASHHPDDRSDDAVGGGDTDVDGEEEDDLDEDPLTDEQRMEEGRRMFQIFAARMFEQRVLQAYLERVAQERQLQLLRELEEEDQAEKDKEAKKAKENQKKKDKKKQAKQQKEEERLRIEKEKAAEEAAVREKQEKQREVELKKQEEIRQKREAERKAKEEERLRKEDEKRKRQEEERAKELEKERKKREKEDRIRADREAKEREQQKAKEQAEAAVRQKKEAEEREKKAAAEEKRAAQQAAQSPSRVSPVSASIPVSPSSVKGHAVPRAPAAVQQASTSPVAQQRSRVASSASSGQNALGNGRIVNNAVPSSARTTSGSASAQPLPPQSNGVSGSSNPSSLPAPPQGLPPRPTTSVVSQPSTLPASLPRPPVQQQSQPVQGSSSAGQPVQAKLGAAPSSSNGTATTGSSVITSGSSMSSATPSPGLTSSSAVPQQSMQGNPVPTSPPSTLQTSQPLQTQQSVGGSRFGASFGVPGIRSPPVVSNGNGYMPTFGNKHVDLGSPTNMNAAASAIGSLNLGPSPPTSSNAIYQQQQHQQPLPQQHQPIGPIGGVLGNSSNHSRAASQDDYGKMPINQVGSGSNIHRPISRPAPGPIGPIGRPRDVLHEDSMSGSGSSMLPEGILGSSALGADDELVEPQPRRISHNAPVTASPGGSFFGGVGSSAGGSAIGSRSAYGSMNSPWASSFGPVSGSSGGSGSIGAPGSSAIGSGGRLPSGSISGSGGLGGMTSPISLTSPTAPNGNSGISAFGSAIGGIHGGSGGGNGSNNAPGSNTSTIDPWSRGPSNVNNAGWDRARYAFEQPSTPIGQHAPQLGMPQHHQQQHHPQQHGMNLSSLSHQQSILGGMNASGPMSPFGGHNSHAQQLPLRSGIFGAPGSALPHGGDRHGL